LGLWCDVDSSRDTIFPGLGVGLQYLALSVAMTACSALVALLAMPFQSKGFESSPHCENECAAHPAALFSVWHKLSGSALSSIWSRSASELEG